MEFYKEILAAALSQSDMTVTFKGRKIHPEKIVEMECYKALQEIETILKDETLEDAACFMKIEEIISVLEKRGRRCGARHDF